MPKVSVLIPLYNTAEEHLRSAVESILSQTYRDFELLIINDSPEKTALNAVVASYTDPRIRIIPNERNLGISEARNRLLREATGEYAAVLDHDDIALPERLEKQVTYLDSHPEIGVLGCGVTQFPGERRIRYPENDHDIRLSLMWGCAVPHSGSMIRRSVLIQNGIFYDAAYSAAQDYELWCRLLPHTRFHNQPDVLMRYRLHGGNTTKMQKKEMLEQTTAIRAAVWAANPALYNEYRMKAEYTHRIRLFGFLPLLKITGNYTEKKVYLFGHIPVATIRESVKMKA